MTTGEAAFSVPTCWMRKARLRPSEVKFKSRWKIISWLKKRLLQARHRRRGRVQHF